MELSQQVIPLPMAQRLKELGVKQKSLFYHIWNTVLKYEGIRINTKLSQRLEGGVPKDMGVVRYYSAYTVAELGEMMPLGYDTMRITADGWRGESWRAYDIDGKDCPDKEYSTEAEARGAMLIHLLESNLITIEEVNSRI